MDAGLLSGFSDSTFDSLVASPAHPFFCGFLLLREIPPSDPYPALNFITKTVASSHSVYFSAALSIKFFRYICELSAFPTPFEETKCGILVNKMLMSIPAIDILSEKIGKELQMTVGKATNKVTDLFTNEKLRNDLKDTIRQRRDLVVNSQLSEAQWKFLSGESTLNCADMTRELATKGNSDSLLSSSLYLRLYEMLEARESADQLPACLRAAEPLFSPSQSQRLSSLLPTPADAPSEIRSRLIRLSSYIRRDISAGIHVEVDQIEYEFRRMVANSASARMEIHAATLSLMEKDDDSKETELLWKLVLFGMHKMRMFEGKLWQELNSALNDKFRLRKKEQKAQRWTEKQRKTAKEPTEKEKITIKQTAEPDKPSYDLLANPWDLPSVPIRN